MTFLCLPAPMPHYYCTHAPSFPQLIPKYNYGERQKLNGFKQEALDKARSALEKYKVSGEDVDFRLARQLRKEAVHMPHKDPTFEGYRRLYYCRHAGSFFIGFAGIGRDAREIEMMCYDFIKIQTFKVDPNVQLIRSDKGTLFLGTLIYTVIEQLGERCPEAYTLHNVSLDACRVCRTRRFSRAGLALLYQK